jgi:hypothetical protein
MRPVHILDAFLRRASSTHQRKCAIGATTIALVAVAGILVLYCIGLLLYLTAPYWVSWLG